MPEPPLDRDDFAKALHAKGDLYWREHPFHQRLHRGERELHVRCPPPSMERRELLFQRKTAKDRSGQPPKGGDAAIALAEGAGAVEVVGLPPEPAPRRASSSRMTCELNIVGMKPMMAVMA